MKNKIFAFLFSCFLIAILLLIGEAYCRFFTRINFLDNSSGLFTANRFGPSYGNTPNFEGISFGERFVTDANGFRIDPAFGSNPQNTDAILLVGDSVGFGPAVVDAKTIAGKLRVAMPNTQVFNASVIGYDTYDYKNVASQIVKAKPEIKSVVLVFCLNDVNDASSQQIRNQTSTLGQAPDESSIPRRLNAFLRSRSKLYLWLKNALLDTQITAFEFDLAYYQKGKENLDASLKPLSELNDELNAKGVKLKIFVMPYEAQLRSTAAETDLEPQRMLNAFFAEHKIESFDLLQDFRNSGANTNQLFLYGDAMHFSEEGHAVVATAICKQLPECNLAK